MNRACSGVKIDLGMQPAAKGWHYWPAMNDWRLKYMQFFDMHYLNIFAA